MALTLDRLQETVALIQQHGSAQKAAKALGLARQTMDHRVKLARKAGLFDPEPFVGGRIHPPARTECPLPAKGRVKRTIFTCAQNNTRLHEPTWRNLQALAKHYKADIKVSTFTYDTGAYGVRTVKRGQSREKDAGVWYAPEIVPHILDESVVVAPGLIWCGEMNILPTAVRPLSGLESYTGLASGIFPHPKFAMESIATGKYESTKFNYTTGTVTQRNYIAKKAGQKAEFHHGYGGLLVEVNDKGQWWVRQLNADSDGTIYDLMLLADGGIVEEHDAVEAITWGDIHVGTIAPKTQTALWGKNGMLDQLMPAYQFMHDVLDFRSRNHHDMKNPHKMFEKFVTGQDDVVEEINAVVKFITRDSYRDWCETVIVDSNHDNALTRWLREADYRQDPKNALFFLRAQTQVYSSIRAGEKKFHLVEWAVRGLNDPLAGNLTFLQPDESFVICKDAHGGVECGMHGDHGPNGSRGALPVFARMGRKSNTGHSHSAGIYDGAYRAGVTGSLDQGYNVGPSSWSHSHIVTYPNGKRAIVTMKENAWRA